MKLIKYAKKKEMFVLDNVEGKENVWVKTLPNVIGYARKTIKPGDEVEVTFGDDQGGMKVVTFMKKAGSNASPAQSTTSQPKFTCKVCGKELKDDKCDVCYTCNKAKPAGQSTSTTRNAGDSIERQNCNNATSRALMALQGQIDFNTIGEVIDTIWDKFYSKLK